MSRRRRVLWLLLGLELAVAVLAMGWRLTRSAPPRPNLSRLPPPTAEALHRLQARVWNDSATNWQELGEAYLAFGYLAEAEPCLRLAVERAPRQYSAVFAYATSLERVGRLTEANEQFARAAQLGLGREPQICQSRIARNCLRLNDVAAAESAFAKAPDLPAAQAERARLLVRTGRAAEALPIIDRLRELQDLDVRTEMAAVQAYRELVRPRDAAVAAERADRAVDRDRVGDLLRQLQPIRARYGLNAALSRGEQLDQAGRPAEAAAVFERAFAESSLDHMELVMFTGARLDLVNRKPDAAVAKLNLVAARMDVPPDARLLWGQALAETNRRDEAMSQWTRALAAQPTAELHLALAEELQSRGDEAAARTERSAARLQAAVDHYRANNLTAAHSELNRLRSTLPEQPRLWYYLGLVSHAQGQPQQARDAFARCLEINPLHGRARFLRDLLTEDER